MEFATTVDFAHAARTLSRAARRSGLTAPGFRSPPRIVGADRTLRRRRDGPVVAVRVRDRAAVAVVADMIEGIVVANDLTTPAADRARARLWQAVLDAADVAGVRDLSMPIATGGGHAELAGAA